MSDDLVSLRILIVSDAKSERDALRAVASQHPVLIDVVVVETTGDASPTCNLLAREAIDVIFLDSRMPRASRQAVIDAAHAAESRPLVVFVGSADLKSKQIATEGIAFDGLLAKPIDSAEARALLDACVRARLPSRVMVVDDSPTIRSVVRKVLQASRYRFEAAEAGEGKAALEQAAKQRFDVVFLDCHMPDFDGFATLAALQRNHPDTKVVMIAATNDTRIADRARAAGADDLLYKPFYAKDVDAVMNRLHGVMRPKAV